MQALLDHGISSKSLADFNIFKRSLIIWNKCMGTAKRLPDSIVSDKLVSAVNDLEGTTYLSQSLPFGGA